MSWVSFASEPSWSARCTERGRRFLVSLRRGEAAQRAVVEIEREELVVAVAVADEHELFVVVHPHRREILRPPRRRLHEAVAREDPEMPVAVRQALERDRAVARRCWIAVVGRTAGQASLLRGREIDRPDVAA